MEPLFIVKCSAELAQALGAAPMPRVRLDLSFPCHDTPRTHHAELQTSNGPFAWLWQIDSSHPFITRDPR